MTQPIHIELEIENANNNLKIVNKDIDNIKQKYSQGLEAFEKFDKVIFDKLKAYKELPDIQPVIVDRYKKGYQLRISLNKELTKFKQSSYIIYTNLKEKKKMLSDELSILDTNISKMIIPTFNQRCKKKSCTCDNCNSDNYSPKKKKQVILSEEWIESNL